MFRDKIRLIWILDYCGDNGIAWVMDGKEMMRGIWIGEKKMAR